MKKTTSEKRKAYFKAYYLKHKDQIKAYHKAYYQKHKDQIKAYHKAYYQKHKDEKIKSQKGLPTSGSNDL